MNSILLHELTQKSSLLTRGTADQILSNVTMDQFDPALPIVVDFDHVVAVTPSFFDQLLGGLKLKTASRFSGPLELRFRRVPTHTPEKFAAVGRSHKMVLQAASDKEWLLVESGR